MMHATKKWDTTRPFSANMNQLPEPNADPAAHVQPQSRVQLCAARTLNTRVKQWVTLWLR